MKWYQQERGLEHTILQTRHVSRSMAILLLLEIVEMKLSKTLTGICFNCFCTKVSIMYKIAIIKHRTIFDMNSYHYGSYHY